MGKRIRNRWTERQIARASIEIEQLFKAVRRLSRNDSSAWAVVQHMLIQELVEKLDKRARVYVCGGDEFDTWNHQARRAEEHA